VHLITLIETHTYTHTHTHTSSLSLTHTHSHPHTHTHSVGIPWTRDRPVAGRCLYLHNTQHLQETFMPQNGFEPAILARRQSQT